MEELEMTLMEGEETMDKQIEAFKRELTTVRTGRASSNILDTVKVEYYGAETPIKQLAAITVPESNQLFIKPFDKSIIKDIEKAIFASGLGLTPQSDSTGIRLVFPKMTEERRRELTKIVLKYEEQAKVQIRNTRRDLNDAIKKLDLPEDNEKGAIEDVQKLTDKMIKEIEDITEAKNKELMTI